MSIVWVSELLFGAALGLGFALGAAAPLVCTEHCVSYNAVTPQGSRYSIFLLVILCEYTQCKDILNVRTTHMVINHCILTAVAPLSKDNLM